VLAWLSLLAGLAGRVALLAWLACLALAAGGVCWGGVVCINCQPPGTPHPHEETISYLRALLVGDWTATRDVAWSRVREGSGLVAAFVSWHMDRGLRSMPLLER